jgi:hypothetical protein
VLVARLAALLDVLVEQLLDRRVLGPVREVVPAPVDVERLLQAAGAAGGGGAGEACKGERRKGERREEEAR